MSAHTQQYTHVDKETLLRSLRSAAENGDITAMGETKVDLSTLPQDTLALLLYDAAFYGQHDMFMHLFKFSIDKFPVDEIMHAVTDKRWGEPISTLTVLMEKITKDEVEDKYVKTINSNREKILLHLLQKRSLTLSDVDISAVKKHHFASSPLYLAVDKLGVHAKREHKRVLPKEPGLAEAAAIPEKPEVTKPKKAKTGAKAKQRKIPPTPPISPADAPVLECLPYPEVDEAFMAGPAERADVINHTDHISFDPLNPLDYQQAMISRNKHDVHVSHGILNIPYILLNAARYQHRAPFRHYAQSLSPAALQQYLETPAVLLQNGHKVRPLTYLCHEPIHDNGNRIRALYLLVNKGLNLPKDCIKQLEKHEAGCQFLKQNFEQHHPQHAAVFVPSLNSFLLTSPDARPPGSAELSTL